MEEKEVDQTSPQSQRWSWGAHIPDFFWKGKKR